LSVIGGGRKVDLIEREGLAVEIDLTAHATQPGADHPVDCNCIGPGFGVIVPHRPPHGIGMERTAYATAFGRLRIAVPPEPGQTVLPAHALLDEWPSVDPPTLEGRL